MTDKNELIRYPVAVSKYSKAVIIDADNWNLCEVKTFGRTSEQDALVAAEIVRVLNTYHAIESKPAPTPPDNDFYGWLIIINELLTGKHCNSPWEVSQHRRKELIMELQEKAKAAEQSSHPAPVAASGDPSDAAMSVAKEWEPYKISFQQILASKIDTAFAAERAEAARTIRALREADEECANMFTAAERERDEARAEVAKWKNMSKRGVFVGDERNKEIAQLRADLDEAVGLLRSCYTNHAAWNASRDGLLFRLAASEPGNCSAVPNSSPPEMAIPDFPFDEPATESGGDGHLHQRINELKIENETLTLRLQEKNASLLAAAARKISLNKQLAERDAEIGRLNAVLAGVEKLIHSSPA